jgi:hypothetical protein
MKLLSFDVGIKNLAYCLFEITDGAKTFQIIDWNTVSLLNDPVPIIKCGFIGKTPKKRNKQCNKNAIYKYNASCYCKTHIPKNLLLPIKNINKYKKEELQEIINHRGDITRTELIKRIQNIMLTTVKKSTIKVGSNDTCLIDIGRKISAILGPLFDSHELDHVIIENQISTIATRMKSIQCMLSQFFIIKHPFAHIEFVSSFNKLKDFVEPPISPVVMKNGVIYLAEKDMTPENEVITTPNVPPTTASKYKGHKIDSIKYCKEYLTKDDPESQKPTTMLFNDSKKKDDLADSFLQGVWYITNKL